jgi:hypothetical protein
VLLNKKPGPRAWLEFRPLSLGRGILLLGASSASYLNFNRRV